MPSDMASENHAVLALSGDCYKARPEGIVIRNGSLYRDTVSGDVCILYGDGRAVHQLFKLFIKRYPNVYLDGLYSVLFGSRQQFV